MAKTLNIQVESTFIPIDFTDEDGNVLASFRFDKSDDAQLRIVEAQNKLLKSVGLADSDSNYSLDNLKDDLEEALDTLLEPGSFKKLYSISPSWEIILFYMVKIFEVVAEQTHNNFSGVNNSLAKYLK